MKNKIAYFYAPSPGGATSKIFPARVLAAGRLYFEDGDILDVLKIKIRGCEFYYGLRSRYYINTYGAYKFEEGSFPVLLKRLRAEAGRRYYPCQDTR